MGKHVMFHRKDFGTAEEVRALASGASAGDAVCAISEDAEVSYDARASVREATAPEAIKLDLYHLVWIFTVCCVVGLIGETVVSFFIDGRWEDRAGFLWGPFSPIYGVGGVLMTVTLSRLSGARMVRWMVLGESVRHCGLGLLEPTVQFGRAHVPGNGPGVGRSGRGLDEACAAGAAACGGRGAGFVARRFRLGAAGVFPS